MSDISSKNIITAELGFVGDALSIASLGKVYFSCALEKYDELRKIQQEDPKALLAKIEHVAFFATNILFSCEIFIKAWLELRGVSSPKDQHDLWNLYRIIPEQEKVMFQDAFASDVRIHKERHSTLQSLFFLVHDKRSNEKLNPSELIGASYTSIPQEISLAKMLKDMRSTYTFWRYYHEKNSEPRKAKVIKLHWIHILIFCNILSRMFSKLEDELGPKRQGKFNLTLELTGLPENKA